MGPFIHNLLRGAVVCLVAAALREASSFCGHNALRDGQQQVPRAEIGQTNSKITHHKKTPLLPMIVMDQYIQLHSVDSLRRNPAGRKFAIVHYSCPDRAGNMLHFFTNGLLLSMVTNRTILWRHYRQPRSQSIEECTPILDRAPWIASYEEWQPILNLPDPVSVILRSSSLQGKMKTFPAGAGGIDVNFDDTALVQFENFQRQNPILQNDIISNYYLHTNWSRLVNKQLHSQGSAFLFGMLLRSSFDFTEAIKQSVPLYALDSLDPSQYYTIALHSRHIENEVNGCNIQNEIQCLQRITSSTLASGKKCTVILMSDRSCTIDRLTPWLTQAFHCQVLVANHSSTVAFRDEHGPYAGAGFFQDWALASMARSAFISNARSSSELVEELIVYRKTMEAWNSWPLDAGDPNGNDNFMQRTSVETCHLPVKSATGGSEVVRPPLGHDFATHRAKARAK